MQQTQKYETKGMNKRQFSSPTTSIQFLTTKPTQQQKTTPKQTGARKTDYTEDRQSQVTNSHINQTNGYQFGKDKNDINSNFMTNREKMDARSRQREIERPESVIMEELMEKQARVVELKERLKNIHHFYRVRIEEERNKNIQRSQIFIGIIEQLQQIHLQKISALENSYVEIQEGDKQLGEVDDRMSTINKKISEVIQKSEQIKVQNQALYAQIERKRQQNDQKQQELNKFKTQFTERRSTLQHFQKLKLKQNQRNKELLRMINAVQR